MPEGAESQVVEVVDGARAALAELMEAHGDAIYGLCLRMLRHREQAEDVLQQTFLQAYRDLATFEGRAAPRSWLYSIAIHRCHDAIKASHRRSQTFELDREAVDAFEDPATDPAATLEHRRLIADLALCVGELPDAVRLAVLLRYQVDMSYEEMSTVVREKADTLQTRVKRSLIPLRRCLERKGWKDV